MDLSILNQMEPRFLKDKEFLSNVIQSLNLPLDAKIVDIGTGWGKMSIYLALHGYSVITGEPEKWSDWETYAKQAGVLDKIYYQKFDAHQLMFSDNTIDAIFLLGSLHHISDKMSGLKEILRILKKDGKIILFDYTDIRIEQIKQHSPHHPPAINPKELLDDLPVSYTESIDEKKEIFCYVIKKN
ncbi:MAG: class I SAM-dependent methyltransferase [Promethearchaeota archaeon]|nr:MAG: class I SAM-dependent methyltransferase [Candidatus Lokiarchaeota archaeon]